MFKPDVDEKATSTKTVKHKYKEQEKKTIDTYDRNRMHISLFNSIVNRKATDETIIIADAVIINRTSCMICSGASIQEEPTPWIQYNGNQCR